MAHLLTQQTRGDNERRSALKRRLVRLLYERGFDRETVRRLYRIVDWMMRLPKPLDDACWQEIKTIEEEKKMPYITTAERYGREIGLVEGLLIALNLNTEQRLWPLSDELKARLAALAPEQIIALIRESLLAPTVDDFIKRIPTAP